MSGVPINEYSSVKRIIGFMLIWFGVFAGIRLRNLVKIRLRIWNHIQAIENVLKSIWWWQFPLWEWIISFSSISYGILCAWFNLQAMVTVVYACKPRYHCAQTSEVFYACTSTCTTTLHINKPLSCSIIFNKLRGSCCYKYTSNSLIVM